MTKNEYELNKKKCKHCFNEIPWEKHSNFFCDRSCAGFYNNLLRTYTEEDKQKQRTLFLKHIKPGYQFDKKQFENTCKFCNKIFFTFKKKKFYCSKICLKLKRKSKSYKKSCSDRVLNTIKNGNHKSFETRTKMKPSFAEQYFIDVFKNENITNYEREFKIIGLSKNMFVDFVFIDKKIALEIDGSQHKKLEQKERDKIKDEWLLNNGWEVIRIPWEGVKNEFKLKRLQENVKFLLNKLK
jgi:very-short-patch-repair endonuclease